MEGMKPFMKYSRNSAESKFPNWKGQVFIIMDEKTLNSRHGAGISDHRYLKKKKILWSSREKKKTELQQIQTAHSNPEG